MMVSDWSSSQQNVGSTQPPGSMPCVATCCVSAVAIDSTTSLLPCTRISPTKSDSTHPMAKANARPSGVTPRCNSAATSGFCSLADASIRRASSASVNHEHTSPPPPDGSCIATMFESPLRTQNVGTAFSFVIISGWVSAAFAGAGGVAGVEGTVGVEAASVAACAALAAASLLAAIAALRISSSVAVPALAAPPAVACFFLPPMLD